MPVEKTCVVCGLPLLARSSRQVTHAGKCKILRRNERQRKLRLKQEYKAKKKEARRTPKYRAWEREYSHKYRQKPEYKAKKRKRDKARRGTLKYKYRCRSSEHKSRLREYKRTPEYKAKKREYRQKPETKAKERVYFRKYRFLIKSKRALQDAQCELNQYLKENSPDE
jgi:hypothetical protein